MGKHLKTYEIDYCYHASKRLITHRRASSAINALRRDRAYRFLNTILFQTGDNGRATATNPDDKKDTATLFCEYTPQGKFHAQYCQE